MSIVLEVTHNQVASSEVETEREEARSSLRKDEVEWLLRYDPKRIAFGIPSDRRPDFIPIFESPVTSDGTGPARLLSTGFVMCDRCKNVLSGGAGGQLCRHLKRCPRHQVATPFPGETPHKVRKENVSEERPNRLTSEQMDSMYTIICKYLSSPGSKCDVTTSAFRKFLVDMMAVVFEGFSHVKNSCRELQDVRRKPSNRCVNQPSLLVVTTETILHRSLKMKMEKMERKNVFLKLAIQRITNLFPLMNSPTKLLSLIMKTMTVSRKVIPFKLLTALLYHLLNISRICSRRILLQSWILQTVVMMLTTIVSLRYIDFLTSDEPDISPLLFN